MAFTAPTTNAKSAREDSKYQEGPPEVEPQKIDPTTTRADEAATSGKQQHPDNIVEKRGPNVELERAGLAIKTKKLPPSLRSLRALKPRVLSLNLLV